MHAQPLAIFVHSGVAPSLHHALGLAMTALVNGSDVMVALFGDGLGGWMASLDGAPFFGEAPWSERFASGVVGRAIPPLCDSLAACREIGVDRFTVLACGGAVEQLGISPEHACETYGIDDVVGLPTIWRRAGSMRIVSV